MTNLYLTTSNVSAATPGGAETTRWKLAGSAGASSRVCNKNCTGAVQVLVTDSATAGTDGNTVAWYSDPLNAVTVAGQIVASLWGKESANTANAAPCIGVYRCDATGAVISAIVDPATSGSQGALELSTTAGTKTCTIAAATVTDTALGAGERLKVTLCIDSAASQGGSGTIGSTQNVQMNVNGATGQSGSSQIAFTETIVSVSGPVVFAATAGHPVTPARDQPRTIDGS